MKFVAVALVAVLFCAASVYAEPLYNVADFRKLLSCVDGVFGELEVKYKELEPHHAEYKAKANEINAKLDECEKTENPDSKNECLSVAQNLYLVHLGELSKKLEDNEGLLASLGFSIMSQCSNNGNN